jgi:protein-S-isoprenylcysteine O-methyltransferase Ste14
MQRAAYAAILFVTAVSVARAGWVLLGLLRTIVRPKDSRQVTWDWTLLVTGPEMALPALAALWLFASGAAAPPFASLRLAGILLGTLLILGGLALTIWSWLSLPSVGTGHYLLEGQPLVTRGAYGVVRNPIYTGAFLIWFGLAAAYATGAVFLLTVLYVIPAYVLYVSAEQRMMRSRYGQEYDDYRRRVGAFVPRLGAAR